MGLFTGHDLVNNEYLILWVKEYRIPIGNMHPIAFFWGIKPFNIPMRLRMINKTIDMFSYYATILLRKVRKKLFCVFSDCQFQIITSRGRDPLLPYPTEWSFRLHQ